MAGLIGRRAGAAEGDEKEEPMRKNLGIKLLGVWLILTSLTPLVVITFSGFGTVMALLGLAAGLLILSGR